MIDKNILPAHWEVKKLGEVVQVLDNLRKPINSAERQQRIAGKSQNELFPYFGATGQVGWIDSFLTEGEYVLIGEDGAPFLDIFKAKAYLVNGKTWVNNHAHILKEKDSISINKYILHYLNSINYREYVNGTTRLKLTKGSLVEIPFILPPLFEQKEIVDKIEELFSELDKGKEQLETARQQLKVYRQAVLNSAVIGEANHTIDSVIDSLDQGWSPKCHNEPSTNNDEWAVIKTTAVQNGHFIDNENKRLPENLVPREQHELKAGDLLITRAGPRVRVGVCCMVKQTRPKLLNCDKVYRMRINKKAAIPEFIELLLNSPKYAREIEKMKTGISDSGLNLTQKAFLKIMIPIPSIEEQIQVVQEIESRLSVCDKVEETINQSLQQAESLRQSILKQAFEGKLLKAENKGVADKIYKLNEVTEKAGQYQISFDKESAF